MNHVQEQQRGNNPFQQQLIPLSEVSYMDKITSKCYVINHETIQLINL